MKEKSIYLHPKDFGADLNTELNDFAEGCNEEWAIVQPTQPTIIGLHAFIHCSLQKSFIQFGFICNSKEVNQIGKFTDGLSIDSYAPPLSGLISTFYLQNFEDHYLQNIRREIDLEICNWFSNAVNEFLPVTTCKIIRNKSRIIATFTEFPYRDSFEKDVTQIAWIWIDRNLSSIEHQGVHDLISSDFAQRRDTRFQAGIYKRNSQSQRFFTKMGFRPLCAHVYLPSLRSTP